MSDPNTDGRRSDRDIPAELDALDFQDIHDIVDEEQGKLSIPPPPVRSDEREDEAQRASEPVLKPPPPPPAVPQEALTPPPPVKQGVTESGVEYIEVSLGTPKQFDQMFRPSDAYAGDHSMDDDTPDEPPPPPKPSLFARLRRSAAEEPKRTLEEALSHAKWYARSLRMRFLVSLVFLVPLLLLACLQSGTMLPEGLRYIKSPYTVILIMQLLHICVIILGVDLLTKGLTDLIHLRPGAETLLLFATFVTLLHSFSIVAPFAVFANSVGFLPYSAVSAASISFALWGQAGRYKALARNYKTVLAGGEQPDVVICEDGVLDQKPGFSRLPHSAASFHHISERPDVATRVMNFLSPLLILFCILLALIASQSHEEIAAHNNEKVKYFLWALAALANTTLPLTTFWVFSGFFNRISARLAHMGAALAGWPAALEMSRGSSAILTDGDLFPPGSVTPNGKRINNNASSQIMSYAASMLEASGNGLFRVFREMLADENGALRKVTGLKAEEGGLSGVIEGNTVLLGNYNFLLQFGIDIPKEGHIKNGVFIAINRQLAGIFVILYIPSGQVEGALTLMDNQKLNMLLATRDFNITPKMLKEKYHVNPDPVDYPQAEERERLSDPARPRQGLPAAVLSRDGLCPYVEAIVGGQRLHRVTLINLVLQVLSLFFGLFVAYYFTRSGTAEAAAGIAPGILITYMLSWWGVQWLISWLGSRY